MKKALILGITLMGTVGLASAWAYAAVDDPEITIKEVMKTAMKGGLAKTTIEGKATAEQEAELLKLFKALAANSPPRGDKASWDEKTVALVNAAQAVVDKKPDASTTLKTAVNCKACHDLHKGE